MGKMNEYIIDFSFFFKLRERNDENRSTAFLLVRKYKSIQSVDSFNRYLEKVCCCLLFLFPLFLFCVLLVFLQHINFLRVIR